MGLAFFGSIRDEYSTVMSKLRVREELPIDVALRIIERIRERGLEEILRLTEKYDNIRLSKDELLQKPSRGQVPECIVESYRRLELCARSFLRNCACRVGGFITRLDWIKGEPKSLEPVNRVGIYVPGGKYPLPSSLLMAVAPARVAGVEEFVVATPPRNSDLIEWVAGYLEVDGFLRLGGVQAIAAMAYGIPEIGLEPVDMIVGPGNAYVTAAKKVISKDIPIDLIAGPSEILILAEDGVPREVVVYDMLAQAEHGPDSMSLALVTSEKFARVLREELLKYSNESIFSSLTKRGGILYGKKEEIIKLSEILMPEHLEIFGEFNVSKAGAIFEGIGVVYGDYGFTGANHILPTGGTLMDRPGLSPFTFYRKFNGVYAYRQGGDLKAQAAASKLAAQFARLEGLEYHARSAEVREKIYKNGLP